MNRIDTAFADLKSKSGKALITFVTAGDPDLATTRRLVLKMEKAGADLIELGIPYSDPIAEGPVIEAANARALKNSIRVADVMALVTGLRKEVKAPLIFLLYYNIILQYGPERFFSDCAKAGLDGLIVPDLPFEERGEIEPFALQYGVHLITMVSPVSEERIERIVKNARGFLYCVSSLGVTGVRKDFSTDFARFFEHLNRYSDLPKALGFGISTPEQVKSLKAFCDGIIVGSAIVNRVGQSRDGEEAVKMVGAYVRELRKALDGKSFPTIPQP